MSSYYQILKPNDSVDVIFKNAFSRNLNPDTIDIDSKNKFIILQILPENLEQFDDSVKDLKMDNVIFSTLDFENIIRYSFDNNIKIRKVQTTEISEDLEEDLNNLLREKKPIDLINFLKDNKINIKGLEIFPDNNQIKLYDSGIVWADADLSKSEKIKSVFKNILKFVI